MKKNVRNIIKKNTNIWTMQKNHIGKCYNKKKILIDTHDYVLLSQQCQFPNLWVK